MNKPIKKKFAILALFGIFSINLSAEEGIFKVAHEQYIKSFPNIKNDENGSEEKNKSKVHVKKLSERELREFVFDIFTKLPQPSYKNITTIDPTFLKNLEVFSGGQEYVHHLFNTLKRTKTIAGEAFLTQLLCNPTSDIATLHTRQHAIQHLLTKPELMNRLTEILLQIKKAEPLVLSYWDKEHPMNEDLLKRIYFGSVFSALNKNQYALELYTRMQHFFGGLSFISMPLIFSLEFALIEFLNAKAADNPISKLEAMKKGLQKASNLFSINKKTFKDKSIPELRKEHPHGVNPALITPQTLPDWFHLLENIPNPPASPLAMKAGTLAFLAFILGTQGYADYKIYQEIKLNSDLANYLHERLIGVQSYVHAINQLQVLLHDEPILAELINVNVGHQSAGFAKLLSLLNHNTFTGQASFFSLTGRVLAAHELMKECKDEFANFMPIAGSVDAYLSIAKLFKDHEGTPARFCFPEYVTADQPYLAADDFWNPMLDPNTVVCNSITFGGNYPHNVILTGPNTGGKSTVIKSVVTNIYLGQTLTIAPSSKLIFTPFAVLNCSMNIADDIASGTSLFKAEVLRAKLFVERIRNLMPGQYAFTVMDEVFSGTSPKEGQEAAYRFTEQLGNASNSICSVATHFAELTNLEAQGNFKNYQVTIHKANDGSLIRPFKLEEGKSEINVAFDILQEEGVFA